jgi:hypothetical protein
MTHYWETMTPYERQAVQLFDGATPSACLISVPAMEQLIRDRRASRVLTGDRAQAWNFLTESGVAYVLANRLHQPETLTQKQA